MDTNAASSSSIVEASNFNISPQEQEQSEEPKRQRLCPEEMNRFQIEVDRGLRPMIWEFPVNQRDEIRRAYLKRGPCQPILRKYPLSNDDHPRSFQASWFELYPGWLEYSHEKDAIFCFPCYLFGRQASNRPGSNAFIEKGFNTWKKVNSGKHCPLLSHIGNKPSSPHNNAVQACVDLLSRPQHIDQLIQRHRSEEIEKNRLRLGASVGCIRWLTFQACAYRGHDESATSNNRGNFIELLRFIGNLCPRLDKVILQNAPPFARYTSSDVQKEILNIMGRMVRNSIRKEIGNAKFCILIDESRDVSKKEKMVVILRFVDVDGFVQERFFDIIHDTDTSASYTVVSNIIDDGATYSQRGDASAASKMLSSFEFIFILHLMFEIMAITNILCQALQSRSQDILNAMHLVSTTKSLLQQLRNDGWPNLLENVKLFCLKHEIEIPDMSAQYVLGRGRSRQSNVTVEHHYRVDIFLVAVDSQMKELNLRFNEQTVELLSLSTALDPSNNYKNFNIESICRLAKNFYPHDFTEQEMIHLRLQLRHYILIRLILTLPVSTATTERAFSAMGVVKTRLRNKMDDDFLANSLVVYIEKDIAIQFSSDSIMDEFESLGKRRVKFS
ncbi:zinc finger MYM-type protein [Trifolium repens]|nr:zinc finger MYM-type protein [Trifolium repens]